jgi:hypothetical protein
MDEAGPAAGSSDRRLILPETHTRRRQEGDEIQDDFLTRGGPSVPLVADYIRRFTAQRTCSSVAPVEANGRVKSLDIVECGGGWKDSGRPRLRLGVQTIDSVSEK